jgi:hypothetical protein
MTDDEPRPLSLLVPLCPLHLKRGAGGECLVCRVERYEAALETLADPLCVFTPRGVQQFAAEAVRPRGTRA